MQLLRDLGHEVSEREIDYGPLAIPVVLARYLRGIHAEAGSVAHPERLERRTRGMALLGSLVPQKYLDRTISGEAQFAQRIGSLFSEVDVSLLPRPRWGRRPSEGSRVAALSGR